MSRNNRSNGVLSQGREVADESASAPSASPSSDPAIGEAKLVALTVGAQFAQSMASEIFKQSIVANAAGVAAILAYLANRKVVDPIPLIWSAGAFLCGVALALIACLLTYTQSTSVLKRMMAASSKGKGFSVALWQVVMGRLGVALCWISVAAFVTGGILAAFGLYDPLLMPQPLSV